MTQRRDAFGRRALLALLAGAAGAVAASGCGGPRAVAVPTSAPESTLKVEPVVDLVAAAGLTWLVEARPSELTASPVLIPAIASIVSEARFEAFAQRHGGVDLRLMRELAVAGFATSTLAVARVPVVEARVEAAFAQRAAEVEGRAVEGEVTRFWGSVGAGREQVAVLGRDAIALERGRLGPLRAAVSFAEGKLHRALPALRADPLARASTLVGDAPLRGFAPGPFDGEWAGGAGGLLRAATAVAASVRPQQRDPHGAMWLTILLTGAWGADANVAAERLGSAFRVLADDPLGRLMSVDHPLERPRLTANPEALRLDVVLDPLLLARGLHAATDAALAEILDA
jgi:hypothetical protein